MKIFLVEDSALIRQNLTELLEELLASEVVGFAEDELSALNWVGNADNACDLIIIDIFLKQGTGLSVLELARKMGRSAKLVVLSNYAAPVMRQRCLALGADQVFDKPDEVDKLISYCQQLQDARAD